LTWDRLLELAAQGHTRARQLVASVREHSEVDTTLIDRCLHQEVRIENLEAEASYRDGLQPDAPEVNWVQDPMTAHVDPDTKRREPGCECDQEEGDSPCVVHGLYEPEAPKGQEAGRWMVGEDGLARKQSFPITESLTRRTYDLERDLAAANARADAAERRVGITRALDRATKAEAERDQLAARVTELEEDKQMYDRSRVELYRQACTPEERAVLEAMSKARIGSDDCGGYFSSSTSSVVMAELANRAAKAKK
jgi:hypothetical protein